MVELAMAQYPRPLAASVLALNITPSTTPPTLIQQGVSLPTRSQLTEYAEGSSEWIGLGSCLLLLLLSLSILCTFLFAFFCSRYSLDHFLNLSLFVISRVFSVSVYFKIELQGPYEEGKMSKDKRMEEEDGVSGK